MRIINSILILWLLIGCKTNKNLVAEGGEPCSNMVLPPDTQYVFYNWYNTYSSVCGVISFKVKDLQNYKKGEFKNGLQDGKWVVEKYHHYDSAGYSKSKRYLGREEYFKNGLRDSIYKIYTHEGKVIYSTNFKKGNGIEKDFYDNGQLYYEIETKDGYFADTLRLYKKNGQLMQKLLYRKDSLIFKKDY